MQAVDVMTTNVVTVRPDAGVEEIAGLLLKHGISAVPVVDSGNQVVGIVSEGDLMRRAESDTEARHSWWLETLFAGKERAAAYIKSHGRKAADVMTPNVVTVTEDSPLHEIARLLEKHRIKRVPVVREGQLVGIVSRANLLQGLAAKGYAPKRSSSSSDDRTIREALLRTLFKEAGVISGTINVVVVDGVVELWGFVNSSTEKKAAEVAAENTPGVKSVDNHLGLSPSWMGV